MTVKLEQSENHGKYCRTKAVRDAIINVQRDY